MTALLELITGDESDFADEEEVREATEGMGIFLNEYTFEVDLFRCGRHKSLCTTLSELTTNGAAKKRAGSWKEDPDSLDPDQMLKDIDAIAKGRFAQRLASRLKGDICPEYIRDAITFLAAKCV